jgi:succinylornithine aminotransferase
VLNGVKQRNQWFTERLSAINAQFGLFDDVRGMGLLIGCVLKAEYAGKAKQISQLAAENGLMVLIAGANVVRFAPALIISEAEVMAGLDRFAKTCERFVSEVSS